MVLKAMIFCQGKPFSLFVPPAGWFNSAVIYIVSHVDHKTKGSHSVIYASSANTTTFIMFAVQHTWEYTVQIRNLAGAVVGSQFHCTAYIIFGPHEQHCSSNMLLHV